MGSILEVFHISNMETRQSICTARFKAIAIYAKPRFKKELGGVFLFFTKIAFNVDREQERATAMENQNQRIIGASATLLTLSTVFVALRLLSRKVSKAGFWVSMCFVESQMSNRPLTAIHSGMMC